MKSQESVLLQVELGLIEDARAAYPHLGGEFDRDIVRITSLVEARGLGAFTLDLPHLDALLLRGLETGRLTLAGPCSHARSARVQVPRLLSGLWLRVFDELGNVRREADETSVAFIRQLCCLGKKTEIPCAPQRVEKTAAEYHRIEHIARSPSLTWASDDLSLTRSDGRAVSFFDGIPSDLPLFGELRSAGERNKLQRVLGNLEHVSALVSSALGCPDPYMLTEHIEGRWATPGVSLRHGPGAVSDLRRGGDKFSFPNWPDKLAHYFPFDAFGVLNLNHLEDRPYPSNHEPASVLIAVPKTAKAPRLIAKEPTAHQWTQQLVASYLIKKVDEVFKGRFLTIRDQGPSRRMALRGSLDKSLCTLDLSSASDRLTCWVVERVFRGNRMLLELLHATRTRWTIDRVSTREDQVLLKKYATQGSALTFPVQSIVFLCCCLAVLPHERSLEGYLTRWGEKVRVYGDDLIVPTERYAEIVDLLHYLGLKVGEEKSFHRGEFRESCGFDGFRGVDVTPVKPKVFSPDNPAACGAVIDSSNNLWKRGFWRAALALESTLPWSVRKNLPVVSMSSGFLGLASFCGSKGDHLRRRWNPDYHRDEVRVVGLSADVRLKKPGGYTGIFHYSVEQPSPLKFWEHGTPVESKTRKGLRWVPLADLLYKVPS